MAVQGFAGCGVDAGGIQPDQHDAAFGEPFDGLGGVGGEIIGPPVLRGMLGRADQHAGRQVQGGMGKMVDGDERAAIDGVDDAAGAEERLQRNGSDGGGAILVVQGRIGVRADMRRQRDFADIDRAAGRKRPFPLLAVRRVAWKDRRSRGDGRGNIPQALHVGRKRSRDAGIRLSLKQ
ncbi:hypothetical protein D9M68_870850 [compost metagenome]